MATKKKMLQAAAGQAGGAGLDITDVFSTYLYTGNGSTQTITNDIDLAGEGGLVWTKSRETGYSHELIDTERGIKKTLRSNGTDAEGTVSSSAGFSSFNSNGYSIAGQFGTWGSLNVNNEDHVSWTFRKAPKFFDVVTYTGTASVQNISHNLGSVPGMIIVKRLDSSSFNWQIYHRNSNATPEDYRLEFTTGAAQLNTGVWGGTAPTDTHFTVGVNGDSNGSGGSFVAYLFAHNDGDGGFGPDGDQDIIKCGSYTGNGSTDGPEIDLGFEPQWIMLKETNGTGGWFIFDAMRGMPVGGGDTYLYANTSDADATFSERFKVTPTGFKLATSSGSFNGSGDTYIYMAIRRGPLAQPESGTEVFNVDYQGTNGSVSYSPFAADFVLDGYRNGNSSNARARPRLTGGFMTTSSTAAELDAGATGFDQMDGWGTSGSVNTTVVSWVWKRAPGFFDVVAYTGNDTPRTLPHNLGAAPEMIITKSRTGAGSNWWTYHSGLNVNGDGRPETDYVMLNSTQEARDFNVWNDTAPTDTVFSLGSFSGNNETGTNYIAYLFASLDGISKVGSYTGNGTSQTIDCGFTSGARFVLIKSTNVTGNWVVYDTARGIVSATEPALSLNTTDAELTGYDLIDPQSGGFTVVNDNSAPAAYETNANNVTYIFYAIA